MCLGLREDPSYVDIPNAFDGGTLFVGNLHDKVRPKLDSVVGKRSLKDVRVCSPFPCDLPRPCLGVEALHKFQFFFFIVHLRSDCLLFTATSTAVNLSPCSLASLLSAATSGGGWADPIPFTANSF